MDDEAVEGLFKILSSSSLTYFRKRRIRSTHYLSAIYFGDIAPTMYTRTRTTESSTSDENETVPTSTNTTFYFLIVCKGNFN